MAELKEYVAAVGAAFANIGTRITDPNGIALVKAYSDHIAGLQAAGKTEVPAFEAWRTDKAKLKAALPSADDAQREAAANAAQNFLNNEGAVSKAKTELVASGKVLLEQRGSFFDKIWTFIKNNKFTAGAAAAGVVAANALGLGPLGMALLGIGGAIAGAVLGDKEHGFIGYNIMNMRAVTPPGVFDAVYLTTPVPGKNLQKTDDLTGVEKVEELGELNVVAAAELATKFPELKNSAITHQVTFEREGREVTYYGKLEGEAGKEQKFVALAVRINDKDADTSTPLVSVPQDRQHGMTFDVKENKLVIPKKEFANLTLIAGANSGMKPTLNLPAAPEEKVEKVADKLDVKENVANLKLAKDKHGKPLLLEIRKEDVFVMDVVGKTKILDGKKVFEVSKSSNTSGAAMTVHTPPLVIALGGDTTDNPVLNLHAVVKQVSDARLKEVLVKDKDRTINIVGLNVGPPDATSPALLNFTAKVNAKKSTVKSDAQDLKFNGEIRGADLVIPQGSKIIIGPNDNQAIVEVADDITIKGVNADELKKAGDPGRKALDELGDKLKAAPALTDLIKKNATKDGTSLTKLPPGLPNNRYETPSERAPQLG